MNICIVTVYDSINCGSYLQAYALGTYLRNIGNNVFYYRRVKTKDSTSSISFQIKRTISKFVKNSVGAAFRYVCSIREFRKCLINFEIVDEQTDLFKLTDCIVLGSDTIWNIQSEYFLKNMSIFWGEKFTDKKVISYAASIANTTESEIRHQSLAVSALKKISSISVRDDYTFDVIKRISNRDIFLTCDPTLLLTPDDYKGLLVARHKYEYIYVYSFETLSKEIAQKLTAFAKENNLHILNGGSTNKPSYCSDASVVSPFRFLTDIYYARFVVTDTFHGTVFSLLFNKQFAVINREKTKVNEFLKQYDLENRIVNEDNLDQCMRCKLNFEYVNMKIAENRLYSQKFLNNNL